jgi:putative DNA primase/helicase
MQQPSSLVPVGHRHFNGARPTASADEWHKPTQLIGQIDRQPYPVDALPSLIGAAVREGQQCTQAPVEMVASSALATASLSAQALADVRRDYALTGPCSLYFVTVAESGERKTTVDKLFTRAVHDWQDSQREASKTSQANHTADLAAWQARRDATSEHMNRDAKTDKSLDGHRADLASLESEKPLPPQVPRLLFEDATPEKLGRSLAQEWPSGGIFSSEGGVVLGGHAMGKDSLSRTLGLINKLWEGGTHTVDRATAASFAVRGARLTVSLQVQLGVLTDFMQSDRGLSRASGFFARFLIAQPRSTAGTRFYRETVSTPELDGFNLRIGELLAIPPTIDPERGLTPALLDLDTAAKAFWIDYFDTVERQLAPSGEFAAIRDVAAKAADNAARLAAVLHVFEHGPTGTISRDVVESAAEIVAWHTYSARAVLGPLSLSRELGNAVNLSQWLTELCAAEGVQEINSTRILQEGPNAIRSRQTLTEALAVLREHDHAREERRGHAKLIRINPYLLNEGAANAA